MRIVINADDFGLTDGVCRAIVELLELGAVSNTTIMPAAESSLQRARKWNVANYGGVVGVHLQLSSGRPFSTYQEAPTIVDPATRSFVERERLREADPEEVAKEWRRQIESVAELLGRAPSHLDSHHGVARLPNCFDVYLALASEYGIPVRGSDGEFHRRMQDSDVRGTTHLIRDWTGRSLGLDSLTNRLSALAENGKDGMDVIEIVTHPGYSDEHLEQISTLNGLREGDVRDLRRLHEQAWLAKNGFELVAYPDL